MSGLLCLTWNNHYSAFLKLLTNLHLKDLYCDATIACHGKYYPVHRLVLSTCSEYFEEIFEHTKCKHPYIIIKDVNSPELEALLNYMYKGEVNVSQESLPALIKAAEGLRIKGLAVSDDISENHNERERKNSSRKEQRSKLKQKASFSNKTNLSEEYNDNVNDNSDGKYLDSNLSNKVLRQYEEMPSEETGNYLASKKRQKHENGNEDSLNFDVNFIKTETIDDSVYTNFIKPETIDDSVYSEGIPATSQEEQQFCSDVEQQKDVQYSLFHSDMPSQKENCAAVGKDIQSEISGAFTSSSEFPSSVQYANLSDNYDCVEQLLGPPRTMVESSPKCNDNQFNLKSVASDSLETFKCTLCPYHAKKKYNLKSHYMYKHSNVRPIRCSLCSFRCILKTDLKRHMSRHARLKM